jgi:23S rRNA (cytosine1962-C5)-methyltransferase
MTELINLLDGAFAARQALFDEQHLSALRLFNGFTEGFPALSVDIYARTALLHNYAAAPADGEPSIRAAKDWILEKMPWVACILVKTRNGSDSEKRGVVVFGQNPDRKIREHGIWYALDLTMNRDASFYMDTRNLRFWALENLGGKTLLNTFAYTGSLGVAAQAAGAARVVQLDRNRDFLNVAKTSYALNGFSITKSDFLVADFFPAVSQFKRAGQTFDCIFLDPPFFAATTKGRVDLENNSLKLINKVRPLINDGGTLIAINNALFVSGREYLTTLESLCADGYLSIEQLIPVPDDFTGYPQTRVSAPPVDPAPFNHATKIAVLRVKRKSNSKISRFWGHAQSQETLESTNITGAAMFTRAIVRQPAANFAEGLTAVDFGLPDYQKTLVQHAKYCAALETCGLSLTHLEGDARYPDSTFVEDVAILTENGALLTRPGAESRAGEVTGITLTLKTFFAELAEITAPGTLDGGDICEAGSHFFIGVSQRTNPEGAQQLADWLATKGYTASLIDIRETAGILHLKSGLAYLGDNRLVVIDSLASHPDFKGYELIHIAPKEDYAANCVRVNNHVLLAAGFPKFEHTIRSLGYPIIALDMSEFQKMDGGLSCLSLRF